jgi:RHS repeat-associated protein
MSEDLRPPLGQEAAPPPKEEPGAPEELPPGFAEAAEAFDLAGTRGGCYLDGPCNPQACCVCEIDKFGNYHPRCNCNSECGPDGNCGGNSPQTINLGVPAVSLREMSGVALSANALDDLQVPEFFHYIHSKWAFDPAGFQRPSTMQHIYREQYNYYYYDQDGLGFAYDSRSGFQGGAGTYSKLTPPAGVPGLWEQAFVGGRKQYFRDPSVGTTNKLIDREVSPHGQTLYYNYDASGFLASVVDPGGLATYFACDASGNVVRLRNWQGRAAYFTYDASSRVVKIEKPGGCVKEFAYNGSDQIVRESDAEGFCTYYNYDPADLSLKSIVRDGVATYYVWDGAYRTRKIDASGSPTYFEMNIGGVLEDTINGEIERSIKTWTNNFQVEKDADPLGNASYFAYDSYGNQTRVQDALGRTTYYSYKADPDFHDLLEKTKDARGNETYYGYDGYGKRTLTLDALANPTYYAYESRGLLESVKDAKLRSTSYEYDAYGIRRKTVDALGHATYFDYEWDFDGQGGKRECAKDALLHPTYMEYDPADRLVKAADALGNFEEDAYNSLGWRTIHIDKADVPTYFTYDAFGRQLTTHIPDAEILTQSQYDGAGKLVASVDGAGGVTYFYYDKAGRQKCVRDPENGLTYFGYDLAGRQSRVADPLGRATYYHFDQVGRQKAVEDALANKTYFAYDEVGNQVQVLDALDRESYFFYDALNRRTCSRDALGNLAYFFFDEVGNQVRSVDAKGVPTYFVHDDLNRLATQWTPAQAALGVEEAATYFGYDAAGNRVRVQDANGGASYFFFDELNRLETQLDAAGNATYYEYTVRSEQSEVKNARGATAKSYFDAAGRMEKQTDAVDVTIYFTFDGAGRTTRTHLAALDQATYLEYDLAGRQTHVKTTPDGSTIFDSETVYNAAGERTRTVNPRGYAAYFEYDLVGRLQKTKDALLNVSYFGYDAVGNRVLAVSPRDYATYFGYDQLNRLARTEDAEGVAGYFVYDGNGNRTVAMVGTGAEARTTYFAFDSVNRLASVTAPDGGVTAFRYDRNGNRVSEENPLGDLTYYGYDERDLLVRVEDALGETAYYEYNEVGSLTKSTSPAGRGGNFEYDQAERRTRAYYGDGYAAYFGFDAAGNMLAAQEAAEGTVYFGYDRMNRATSQKFAAGAGGGSAYYAYDEDSNRVRLQYPSGGTAYYVFDELDRVSSVKAPSGNVTSCQFDRSGNRTKSVWGNGAYSYYEFDKAERAKAIRHFKSDGTALAYFEYGRDGRGNIVRIGRLDGLTTYYSYDEADRLASETWKDSGGSTVYAYEWGYDLAGNRTSAVEQGDIIAWSYNAAGAVTSRVDDSGATYYHHDLDGNLEIIEAPGGAVTYFEHGDHGLLTKIKPLGGTEISFAYDAMLRRVRVDEGSDHTYFRHDGIIFIEIARSDGTVTKVTHGHADIPGIGSVTEEETGGTSVFSIKDPRGTREAEVDASGTVTRRAFVNAFGLEIAASGTASSIFWYQGEAWWKLTVNGRLLYISPFRIYDPEAGRFIERDLPGGLRGRYTYALQSPLRYIDVLGLAVELVDKKATLAKNDEYSAGITGDQKKVLDALIDSKYTFKYKCPEDLKKALDRRVAYINAMHLAVTNFKWGHEFTVDRAWKGKGILELIDGLVNSKETRTDCFDAVLYARLKLYRDSAEKKLDPWDKELQEIWKLGTEEDQIAALKTLINKMLEMEPLVGGVMGKEPSRYREVVPGDSAYFENKSDYIARWKAYVKTHPGIAIGAYRGINAVMNAELKYLHFPGPGTGSTADEILQELVNEGYNKIPDLPPEARITKADLDARPKISFEPDLDLRLDKVGG